MWLNQHFSLPHWIKTFLTSVSVSAEIVNYEFDTKNLVCLVISSVVGVWYLLKKVKSDRLKQTYDSAVS